MEHTQRTLFEALLTGLKEDGLGAELGAVGAGPLAEGLVEKLTSEGKPGASNPSPLGSMRIRICTRTLRPTLTGRGFRLFRSQHSGTKKDGGERS